ncbi:hypothetical protein T12_10938, partial [Trichinella patagoniensis]
LASVTAGAIGAAATWSALALAVVLGCRSIHHHCHDALLSLNDVSSVAASLLHALGLVSAVAVAAGVRHG